MRNIFLLVLTFVVLISMSVDASVVLRANPIKIKLANGRHLEIIDSHIPYGSDGVIDSLIIYFPGGKEKWIICAPGGTSVTSSTYGRPIDVSNPNDPWFTEAVLFRIIDGTPQEMWKPEGLLWAWQEFVNARFARIKLHAQLQRLQMVLEF